MKARRESLKIGPANLNFSRTRCANLFRFLLKKGELVLQNCTVIGRVIKAHFFCFLTAWRNLRYSETVMLPELPPVRLPPSGVAGGLVPVDFLP